MSQLNPDRTPRNSEQPSLAGASFGDRVKALNGTISLEETYDFISLARSAVEGYSAEWKSFSKIVVGFGRHDDKSDRLAVIITINPADACQVGADWPTEVEGVPICYRFGHSAELAA